MRHSGGRWTERWRRAEAWLLPAACLLCGRPVDEPDEPLACALCRTRWRRIPRPICPRCGEPRLADLACRTCADWPRDLEVVRSAVVLDDAARRLVHRLKYQGWRRLAETLALPMVPLLDEVGAGPLVPIPTSGRRLRSRGYNQAGELAREIARQAGRRLGAGWLSRHREVGSQTRLGAAERRANLAGVFLARPVSGPVVLVDDVFTTGATLVSAATACLDAGATRVAALTFARAEPPLVAAARRLHSL